VQFSNGVSTNTYKEFALEILMTGAYPWWGGAEFIIPIGRNSASGSLWTY
jgi:hypothetical protein